MPYSGLVSRVAGRDDSPQSFCPRVEAPALGQKLPQLEANILV